MTTIQTIQSNFTRGQLSERIIARTDFDGYYKGVFTLENMVTIPQGGAKRRFGTKFIADVSENISSAEGVQITILEYQDINQYPLLFKAGEIEVFDDGVLVANVTTPYTENDISKLKWAQTDSTLVVVHPNYTPRVLVRGATSVDWSFNVANFKFFPTEDFDGGYTDDDFTFLPSGTNGEITLTASQSIFTDEMVGGVYIGNEGTMRITTINSPTEAAGFTLVDFANTDEIRGDLSFLSEPVFSNTRGWPISVSFYQNRLVFGGTASLPSGVWLSVINDYFNFNIGEGNDADSIGAFVRSRRACVVQNVLGTQTLLVFTSSGIFSAANNFGEAITPSNFSFTEQTTTGIANVPPVFMDNQVFYSAKNGKIVRSLDYDLGRQSYKAINVSVTTDVIDNPVDIATYDNPGVDDGNFIIFVNADGSLAILTTLQEQNVQGWSAHQTDGEILHVGDTNDNVWFIVKRVIDSVNKYYLEQLDFTKYMDCVISGINDPPNKVISGLASLNNKNVYVRSEGAVFGPYLVVNGQITVDTEIESYNVGLTFEPKIVPMPINIDTGQGSNLYLPKIIQRVVVDYIESYGIFIDGQPIPELSLPFTLDSPPNLKTGFSRFIVRQGWEPILVDGIYDFAQIEITQPQPFPLLIRGLNLEVKLDLPQEGG